MRHRSTSRVALLVVSVSLFASGGVRAAGEPDDAPLFDIDIPAMNAADGLNRLSEQTGAIMLFPYDLAANRQANAVRGRFTLMGALSNLLKDSGLSGGLSDKRVIQIALTETVDRGTREEEAEAVKVSFAKQVGTLLTSLFVISGAAAQEAEQDENVLEEVVVTGSRIPRDSFNVSTPLVTVGREEMTDTGLGSLAEILIDEVPSLYESTSNTNSQSQIGNTGLTSMNLRQLGSNRTLVLIDGRRTVQNAYGGRYVSLNTIPAGLVDRIEVITGGSSAAYGSDAVSGVVNIITVDDAVGFGLETRGGYTTEGGGEQLTVNADYGTSFADGRGYLFAAATYNREYGIDWKDRSRAQIESDFNYNTSLLCNEFQTETGDQCVRDIDSPADYRNRSDGIAGGVFSENRGNWWFDENNTLRTDWVEERDGVFTEIWEVLSIPNEQYALSLKLDYDITDSITAYSSLLYSRNDSFNLKSPEDESEADDVATIDPVTGAPGEVRPDHISIDNPFIPDAIRNDPNFAANWTGDWDRRMYEVGNISTDNERDTLRGWFGLQGNLFNDEWTWDASLGYGRFEQYQLRSNEIDVVREAQALDAELAPDGVTIQCADPAARAAGCVPLNLFGVGSITPEMADWIRNNPVINPVIEQVNFLTYISGDLFELPAGPVGTAFGIEYNRDSMDLQVRDGPRFGGITFNLVPAIKGDIDVVEAFGEARVPVTGRLNAEFSARVGEYSPENIGTVFSYSTGLIWEPVDGYILRANFARAQRAPDITELLSPRRGDFDSFNDICDGVSATSTGSGHDNCRLDPKIAALIAEDPAFVFEDENNGYSPSAGNPDLFEETADTITVGFSIAPSFLDGFRLAVDYYDIVIEDSIIEIENDEILKQCYATSVTFGEPNPFCDDITRDGEGQLIEVLQRQFNLNRQSTSGFDVALDYVLDIGRFGNLQLTGNYTHISEHEARFDGVDGLVVDDFNNQLDFGIFEDVATVSLSWRLSDWRFRWRTAWKGPIVDHDSRVEEYEELFAENDALCAAGDPGCIANPEVPSYLFYPSYVRHDLSVSYDMSTANGTGVNLFAGVRNLFDKDPFVPLAGDNVEAGVGNYDSKFGGGIGRFVFAGAELRFGGR